MLIIDKHMIRGQVVVETFDSGGSDNCCHCTYEMSLSKPHVAIIMCLLTVTAYKIRTDVLASSRATNFPSVDKPLCNVVF